MEKSFNNIMNEIEFYKQTSCFTELGLYRDFAKNLSDDIRELCQLQRWQIIHPVVLIEMKKHGNTRCRHGNITQIPFDRLLFENERFPTALGILAELLRRDKNYSCERKIENKMHLTCREQAILLAAILKAKGTPARVRSGFAPYITNDGINHDHWITEWFDQKAERWVLTDADCCWDIEGFDYADMPRNKFIFGAQAYLGLRNGTFTEKELEYASVPPTLGMKSARIKASKQKGLFRRATLLRSAYYVLQAVFYDFHSLMNNEIFFWHSPRYIVEKNFVLTESEFAEIDSLAELMLEPDKNFSALQKVWENTQKFRILAGGFN